MSVSMSLCCPFVVCEDSQENAELRWGKEEFLPRHSMATSPKDAFHEEWDSTTRIRLGGGVGVGGSLGMTRFDLKAEDETYRIYIQSAYSVL